MLRSHEKGENDDVDQEQSRQKDGETVYNNVMHVNLLP
jgi:hypothetical protein